MFLKAVQASIFTFAALSATSASAAPTAAAAISAATSQSLSRSAALATEIFGANSPIHATLATIGSVKSSDGIATLNANASNIESILSQVASAQKGSSSAPGAKEFAQLLSSKKDLIQNYINARIEFARLGWYGATVTLPGLTEADQKELGIASTMPIELGNVVGVAVDYVKGDASDKANGLLDDVTNWMNEAITAATSGGKTLYGSTGAQKFAIVLASKWSDQEFKKSKDPKTVKQALMKRIALFFKHGC